MNEKVALITGGASGIGRALGSAMAGQGGTVVLADRDLEAAEAAAQEIRDAGGEAAAVELDVRDPRAFTRVAQGLHSRHGRIDFLFNNAGIVIGGEVADYDGSAWDEVFDVNLRGVAHGIQAVYPLMREQGSGQIVNTASILGLVPAAGIISYTATKHAVVGLSKALRIEAAHHGIGVSVLCPGAIRTPILTGGKHGRLVGTHPPENERRALSERIRPMDSTAFANAALRAVAANEPIIIIPRRWKAAWYLDRLSPRLSLALWRWIHRQARAERDRRIQEPIPS